MLSAAIASRAAEITELGGAHLSSVLTARAVRELWAFSHSLDLRPAEARIGLVTQSARIAVVDGDALRGSAIASFVDEFEAIVRTRLPSQRGYDAWRANEATYMEYDGAAGGISGHYDRRCYKLLIAVFSLRGHARFELLRDREGRAVTRGWRCSPADVVLLRAPGLDDEGGTRPLHRLCGVEPGVRGSLTLRMAVPDIRADE